MNIKKYIPQILILSQIAGLYGGMLQLPRFLGILFLPFLLKDLNNEITKYKILYILMVLLMVHSLFSMIFLGEHSLNAFKEFCYFLIHLIIMLEIINFSKYLTTREIINTWVLFIFLTVPIALIEINFNIHFSNSKFGDDRIVGGIDKLKQYAAITYENYNLYNHLITLVFPFVIIRLNYVKKKFYKFLYLIFIMSIFYIVLTNASRGTLACLIIELAIYLFLFSSKKLSTRILILFLSFLGLLIIPFILENNDSFEYIVFRLKEKGFEDKSRTELLNMGLDMFVSSPLFGIGSGNFMEVAKILSVNKFLAPHNLFIELLAQYGIIIFLVFVYLLYLIFRSISINNKLTNYILISTLFILPITSTINSVYLSNPFLWIWLSTMCIISYRNANDVSR